MARKLGFLVVRFLPAFRRAPAAVRRRRLKAIGGTLKVAVKKPIRRVRKRVSQSHATAAKASVGVIKTRRAAARAAERQRKARARRYLAAAEAFHAQILGARRDVVTGNAWAFKGKRYPKRFYVPIDKFKKVYPGEPPFHKRSQVKRIQKAWVKSMDKALGRS